MLLPLLSVLLGHRPIVKNSLLKNGFFFREKRPLQIVFTNSATEGTQRMGEKRLSFSHGGQKAKNCAKRGRLAQISWKQMPPRSVGSNWCRCFAWFDADSPAAHHFFFSALVTFSALPNFPFAPFIYSLSSPAVCGAFPSGQATASSVLLGKKPTN